MSFDQWWEAKHTLYGRDDGIDFISLADIEKLLAGHPLPGLKPRRLIVRMLDDSFELGMAWIPGGKTTPPSRRSH